MIMGELTILGIIGIIIFLMWASGARPGCYRKNSGSWSRGRNRDPH